MPLFQFEAVTYAGKTERGTVEGESVRAVRQLSEPHVVRIVAPLELGAATGFSGVARRDAVWGAMMGFRQ